MDLSSINLKRLESLLSERERRTVLASMYDSAGVVIASGRVRMGTADDPGNIFYPEKEELPREQIVARADHILAEGALIRIASLRDCGRGTEPHFHFT